MSALQQFYQSRHNRDANSHHTTQTDRHAQRKLLYVALQRNFNLFNVAFQRCLGSSKISLCDKPFVDELCLFFGQNLGLRFGHTRCGQAVYKAMRVKCNCVHRAKLTCDNDSGNVGDEVSRRPQNSYFLRFFNSLTRPWLMPNIAAISCCRNPRINIRCICERISCVILLLLRRNRGMFSVSLSAIDNFPLTVIRKSPIDKNDHVGLIKHIKAFMSWVISSLIQWWFVSANHHILFLSFICNFINGMRHILCANCVADQYIDIGPIPFSRNLHTSALSLTNAPKRGNTINSGPDTFWAVQEGCDLAILCFGPCFRGRQEGVVIQPPIVFLFAWENLYDKSSACVIISPDRKRVKSSIIVFGRGNAQSYGPSAYISDLQTNYIAPHMARRNGKHSRNLNANLLSLTNAPKRGNVAIGASNLQASDHRPVIGGFFMPIKRRVTLWRESCIRKMRGLTGLRFETPAAMGVVEALLLVFINAKPEAFA